MSANSKIEWTDSTWNPVTGCSKVSQGCKHCYALRDWKRLSANPKSVYYGREFTNVQCHPERLDQPLRWRKPRRIFVNSMSDLFHGRVPDEFLYKVFAVMSLATNHVFQVLTKRPKRMQYFMNRLDPDVINSYAGLFMDWSEMPQVEQFPPANIWLGVSVEDQATADERIPLLLETPAAVRWISAEPLLGSIQLYLPQRTYGARTDGKPLCAHCCNGDRCDDPSHLDRRGCPYCRGTGVAVKLDWVVAGGESGPEARPSHPDWFRSLRDQCAAAGVPFHFKQWGEWVSDDELGYMDICDVDRCRWEWLKPDGSLVDDPRGTQHAGIVRVGKKCAGRLLDGRQHDHLPAH